MESNDNLWQEMQTQETRCDLRQGKDLGLVKYGEIHRGKVLFNDAHGRMGEAVHGRPVSAGVGGETGDGRRR